MWHVFKNADTAKITLESLRKQIMHKESNKYTEAVWMPKQLLVENLHNQYKFLAAHGLHQAVDPWAIRPAGHLGCISTAHTQGLSPLARPLGSQTTN